MSEKSFVKKPPLWLIVPLAGLSQLAETVYAPSLPQIAKDLHISENQAEYTLTIYLFGFALGNLFWGKLSDRFGRKPCILWGLIIFTIGCLECSFAHSIQELMLGRLIQAFGVSVGSVLSQAMCRDVFHGQELGKVYATVGTSLALFPAIGPTLGWKIAQQSGWPSIFTFLVLVIFYLLPLIVLKLPETHPFSVRKKIPFWATVYRLARDKKVLGFNLIVAACNGIFFSYFAESAFFFVQTLGVPLPIYGLSFILLAAATMAGGLTSRIWHKHHTSKTIMNYGVRVILWSTSCSSLLVLMQTFFPFSFPVLALLLFFCQMGCSFGICMATGNALALSLQDYKDTIGVASSICGFFYYMIISLFTFFMGWLHNGTLLPMPLYFLFLSGFMSVISHTLLKNKGE